MCAIIRPLGKLHADRRARLQFVCPIASILISEKMYILYLLLRTLIVYPYTKSQLSKTSVLNEYTVLFPLNNEMITYSVPSISSVSPALANTSL